MPIKLTLLGSNPTPLPADIKLASESITLDWDVVEYSDGGRTKLRRSPEARPVRIALQQRMGLDRTLHELAKRTAGIGLKITHTMDSQGDDGKTKEIALLDIDLEDLVPDDFVIGPTRILHLVTKTEPKIDFPADSAGPAATLPTGSDS